MTMTLAESLSLSGLTGIIDAVDLRNAGSTVATLNGRTGNVSGTVLSNADGVRLDGSRFTLAGLQDMRPCTVIADIEGSTSPLAGYGGVIYVTTTGGMDFGGGVAIMHNGAGGQFFTKDGFGATNLSSDLGASASALGFHATDSTGKVSALTFDAATKPCVSMWANGKHVASACNGPLYIDTPLTQVTIGAKHAGSGSYQDHHRCTLRSLLILDHVASPAEHMAAANALMRLNRRPEIFLDLGDSWTTQGAATALDNWPLQLSRSVNFGGRYLFLNHAVNGSPAGNGAIHWRERASGYTQPVTLIVFCGIAGVLLNYTAANEWAAIRHILREARKRGDRTFVCTLPQMQAGGLTAPQQTELDALNVLIRANPAEYDALIDVEAALAPYTADASYWTNATHVNGKGKAVIAKLIASGGII